MRCFAASWVSSHLFAITETYAIDTSPSHRRAKSIPAIASPKLMKPSWEPSSTISNYLQAPTKSSSRLARSSQPPAKIAVCVHRATAAAVFIGGSTPKIILESNSTVAHTKLCMLPCSLLFSRQNSFRMTSGTPPHNFIHVRQRASVARISSMLYSC